MISQNRGKRSLLAKLASALASMFSQDRTAADGLSPSPRRPRYEDPAPVAQVKQHSHRQAKVIPFPVRAQGTAASAGSTPFLLPPQKLSIKKVPSLVMMLSPQTGLR
jgi:hypothetical protein